MMDEADRIVADIDRMHAERARRKKRRQRREEGLTTLFRLPYVITMTVSLIAVLCG
jgi:hypothetical protein